MKAEIGPAAVGDIMLWLRTRERPRDSQAALRQFHLAESRESRRRSLRRFTAALFIALACSLAANVWLLVGRGN